MRRRTYKYRIYPTPEQASLLAKSFGHARWVYNEALALQKKVFYKDGKAKSKMDYSDLDKQEERNKEDYKNHPCLRGLVSRYRMEIESQRMVRKFVSDNMKGILDEPFVEIFNIQPPKSYFTKNISTNYALGLKFPPDIKKDWAEPLRKFLDHWLVALNYEYMVSVDGSKNHWPESAKADYEVIRGKKKELEQILLTLNAKELDSAHA